jgi:hypothetical protein
LAAGGGDLWVGLLGRPRGLPTLRQQHWRRELCPTMTRNVTTLQLLQPGEAGSGAQPRRWSTNHDMPPCSSCNFASPLPLAHTHYQSPLADSFGAREPRINDARVCRARASTPTLWPLESNHQFVAALAPLAGSICTPHYTTYIRATLRAQRLQICRHCRKPWQLIHACAAFTIISGTCIGEVNRLQAL